VNRPDERLLVSQGTPPLALVHIKELKENGRDQPAVQFVTLERGKLDAWHSKFTKRIFNVS
jgi:hypothetical protein